MPWLKFGPIFTKSSAQAITGSKREIMRTSVAQLYIGLESYASNRQWVNKENTISRDDDDGDWSMVSGMMMNESNGN